jgi:hypothetical protein
LTYNINSYILIVNSELRQFISHTKGWHLSCRLFVRKTGEGDASWVFKNVDDIDQYLGFVETDDYEQAEKMFNEKVRL